MLPQTTPHSRCVSRMTFELSWSHVIVKAENCHKWELHHCWSQMQSVSYTQDCTLHSCLKFASGMNYVNNEKTVMETMTIVWINETVTCFISKVSHRTQSNICLQHEVQLIHSVHSISSVSVVFMYVSNISCLNVWVHVNLDINSCLH